jgi:acetyl esterase
MKTELATEKISTIPTVEPTTQAFLDQLAAAGGPPLYELTPADARAVLRNVQSSVTFEVPPTDVEDRAIKGGPTGEVSIRIVRPKGLAGLLPAVVYSHGGGWILGDKETHLRLIQELAAGAGAIVVFTDYTNAPEAQYPVQNEQAYTTLEWVAQHGEEVGIDTSRVAVAGESVGGNMTAALTLMAKERKGPEIIAQLIMYPVTDADLNTESYLTYADGPWLTREAMRWFWDAYLPDVSRRSEPTASPLNATLEQLSGLPPALIVTDENDVLRDEGEAYAHKLAQAGVSVMSERYLGTIHDFALLNPIAGAPAGRAIIEQATAFLRDAFAL